MTNYNVSSGHTRFRLFLHDNDTATVASGGLIVATADAGTINLDGGLSIGTAILSGGTELVASGRAIGTVVENGGILYTGGSGSITGTLIERGGNMIMGNFVDGTGTGNDTLIDGGTETLYAHTSEKNDVIENGGTQYLVQALTVARNVTIDHGGKQITQGMTFGVIVNSGGLQDSAAGNSADGFATGTVVNSGGEQLLDGGLSVGTVINSGGLQDVYSGARGTIIHGGTMIVEGMAETGVSGVADGIRFTGSGGVLELALTTLTSTTIFGFASSDRIDLLDFGFTSSATVSLAANNVLSIQGLVGGLASLTLDPTANYGGDKFKLSADGHGGTNLTVQAASCQAIPTLSSLQAAASAEGDPLGLQASFTTTASLARLPASVSGMRPPETVGGSSQADALLMPTTSSLAHLQLLLDHSSAVKG